MSITERLSTALADRYTIERELGAAGMATVYVAEDLNHKRKVAMRTRYSLHVRHHLIGNDPATAERSR